jgi:putative sigma-54 modulation protein
MKYEYTGRHIDVTPALRSHVEEHFERINHLFDDNGRSAHVIIEVEHGGNHRSEIIVKWRDRTLTATTSDSDMYKSLTQTIDKIKKQALRSKDKIIDKHQKVKKVSTVIASPITDAEVVPAAVDAPEIIASDNYAVKPMTADEAVLQLKGEENQFVVFRNADAKERVSIIYKRKDGNYGLIQP